MIYDRLVYGLADECDSRVAFVTENKIKSWKASYKSLIERIRM